MHRLVLELKSQKGQTVVARWFILCHEARGTFQVVMFPDGTSRPPDSSESDEDVTCKSCLRLLSIVRRLNAREAFLREQEKKAPRA